jgi:hypothetical protein
LNFSNLNFEFFKFDFQKFQFSRVGSARQPGAPSAAHLRPKNSLASAKNAGVFKAKLDQKSQYRRCKWHKAAHSQSAWQRARAAGRQDPRAAGSPIDRPKTSVKCGSFQAMHRCPNLAQIPPQYSTFLGAKNGTFLSSK